MIEGLGFRIEGQDQGPALAISGITTPTGSRLAARGSHEFARKTLGNENDK
jgi:hypothetical protein